jgi:predicted amidophosphoribosyltransferase
MKCPSCGAAVEEGADLCLECGEPMGDSPVARVVRNEEPAAAPPVKAAAAPAKAAPAKAAPVVKARRVEEDPEPSRCPGCGMLSRRDRCPNCGTILRRDDD